MLDGIADAINATIGPPRVWPSYLNRPTMGELAGYGDLVEKGKLL